MIDPGKVFVFAVKANVVISSKSSSSLSSVH